jgi:SNF2 family DNA or RNA helicase
MRLTRSPAGLLPPPGRMLVDIYKYIYASISKTKTIEEIMTDTKNDDVDVDMESSSDIELEGVDMEEDDDDSRAEVHDEDGKVAAAEVALDSKRPGSGSGGFNEKEENDDDDDDDDDDDAAKQLATKEAAELEATRKERFELLKAEQEAMKNKIPPPSDTQSRLDYLLHQSDVFAHFLAGSVAATNKKKKKVSNSTAKSTQGGRLTEEEEDELLLKSAQSQRHSVVRLDKQPSILAPICKMHPYQLDGLNWMIKLHDHGINAILADGTLSCLKVFGI